MVFQRLRGRHGLLLVAIVAAGFLLRLVCARGDLWLDEAWSAQLAHEAGTPLGVFLNINHDNNHHLNSLWLQFVGFGAPPLLARALSIATGTIAIAVAARIAATRGPWFAVVVALLFAISPIMVTLGSEARGYAPMSLALLSAILLVDRRLAGDPGERTPFRLALCFALGALSQLTMVFGCVALIGWGFFTFWKRTSLQQAIIETLRLFLPAIAALAITLGIIFGAAYASPTGFQFGRYETFGWLLYFHGLIEMLGYTIGYPIISIWLVVAVPILVVLARQMNSPRLLFYRLAIIAFPVTLAALQLGNPGHPRYYLVVAIALLLMIGELLAAGLVVGGWRRWIGVTLLAAFSVGSLVQDAALIRNQRGDPGGAVRYMKAHAPTGAQVLLDRATGLAQLQYSAAALHYPLAILDKDCAAAPFLFMDRFKGETFPATVDRCGQHYLPIAGARADGLSGAHWTLYGRQSAADGHASPQ